VPGARADARLCGYQAVSSADRSARWWFLGQPFARHVLISGDLPDRRARRARSPGCG